VIVAGTVEINGAPPTPLEWLALEVAVAAPEQFSVHGTKSYVPRQLIEKLREELERQGVDWRKVRRDRQRAAHQQLVRGAA
jgi:hypothetical protein